jgi:predicted RNA-binding protein Jag
VQAACVEGKVKDARLEVQINELASKGLITGPLRQWAHEVRLEGGDAAHPGKDGLNEVTEQDAEDIIQFAREFLHHLYVMPSKLAVRQEARAKAKPATT